MTTSLTQERWLTSVTLSKPFTKDLMKCGCNCPQDCRTCLSLIEDSDFLQDFQISEGLCRCSLGDCVCVTFHALLSGDEMEPGDSLAICGSRELVLTETTYQTTPGHSYTISNSTVDCPKCLRKKSQYWNTGGTGWAFPRVPDLSQADAKDLDRWSEWTTELIRRIKDRAAQPDTHQ